jgi:aspartate kinase
MNQHAPLRIVVQKYGGSSVATVEKLRAVAQRIVDTRRAGFSVVVVVSAMGDTTDELLTLARQVAKDPPRRELDMLLSVGERISMALLSSAIQELGEQAISFTGSQCGIVTNDSHSAARIIEIRPFRVQDELARGRVVIVAGYQGTSYRNEITTLGRGGSDTTAVALAAALGAEACDIYSDVAGVYSADPRIVPDAHRLESLTHEEMQEYARHGARVLNPQAVEFARARQIAIYARSTFGGAEHTVVRRSDGVREAALLQIENFGVVGIAGARDRILVTWTAPATGGARINELLEHLGDTEVIAMLAAPQDGRIDILLSGENIPDVELFSRRVTDAFADTVSVSHGLGTATAVGLGAGQSPVAVLRAKRAIDDAGIPVVALFTSRESICAVVDAPMCADAVRALHAAFVAPRTTSNDSSTSH